MSHETLTVFSAIAIAGLVVMLLGLRLSRKSRHVIETVGAIIFHVGVFGILYYKVSMELFVSLVTLVCGLFVLIDPLKVEQHLNGKIYRLVGYSMLFTAVIFSMTYLTGFPVYLWAVPIVVYLAPYLVSSLRHRMKLILAMAWLIVIVYVGIIGNILYGRYYPNTDMNVFSKFIPQFPVTHLQDEVSEHETEDALNGNTPEKDTPVTTNQIEPLETAEPSDTTTAPPMDFDEDGPFLKSLKNADEKYLKLQTEYDNLKTLYDHLADENKKLKKEMKDLKKMAPSSAGEKTETL